MTEEAESKEAPPAEPPSKAEASKPVAPRKRAFLPKLLTLLITTVLCAGAMELTFTVIENRELAKTYHRNAGGTPDHDARWGWKPTPGEFEEGSSEFQVKGHVNPLFMNDGPFDPAADRDKTRIMSLGDSHTYATGVSMHEAWPKVIADRLNQGKKDGPFRGYNAGCYGYNLHQYLLRLIDQGPALQPHYVVVGFSYATDLYDLLPPDHGGWTYGGNEERDYFDFDASGKLELRHWKAGDPQAGSAKGSTTATELRNLIWKFATFRAMRRSSVALYIGSHLTVGGQSLWPNMDVILEKEVSPKHEYSWRLAEALILRMKEESDKLGARLVIAGIPYLPQVYDEVWKTTFAGKENFSKTAAIERMRAFCGQNGIAYIDTLDALAGASRKAGHWLHHRHDGHPTAEGQAVIAEAIAGSGLFAPAGGK